MNLRQHKRMRDARTLSSIGILTTLFGAAGGDIWADLARRQAVRHLVEPEPVEAARVEYVVAKKSTGEVVGTFDSELDALAMIEKAKKAKKASLVLV